MLVDDDDFYCATSLRMLVMASAPASLLMLLMSANITGLAYMSQQAFEDKDARMTL